MKQISLEALIETQRYALLQGRVHWFQFLQSKVLKFHDAYI